MRMLIEVDELCQTVDGLTDMKMRLLLDTHPFFMIGVIVI
jgi:hypothetical protein